MYNLSVVIPVYNNMDIINTLTQKLTFLSQNYSEILVIDDCSSDSTYETIKNFLNDNNLKNIQVFKNEINKGPSYSRNVGLKKATEEYIAFLDSDDDWHPQKIEIQIKLMQEHNVKICGTMHGVIGINELDTMKSIDYMKLDKIPFSIVKWPKILFISPFATPSVIVDKTLTNYLFDENIRYSEDYNLWKRITYKHKAIKILLPLTYTFKHDYLSDGNSLSSNLKKMQLGVEESFKKLLCSKEINKIDKVLLFIGLNFSRIKYVRRILKSILLKAKVR